MAEAYGLVLYLNFFIFNSKTAFVYFKIYIIFQSSLVY